MAWIQENYRQYHPNHILALAVSTAAPNPKDARSCYQAVINLYDVSSSEEEQAKKEARTVRI
jgi:hypothetical protein